MTTMRHEATPLMLIAALALALMPVAAKAQFDPLQRIASCRFKHPVRSIASLADVPRAIRDAVGPMADKNAFFNATDVFQPGVPSRGFVSAGQSGDRYFVWYEQGGIALFSQIAVYRLPFGAAKAELVTQQNESGGDLCLVIDTLLDAKGPT
jgi:hypothetical protein